MSEKEQVSVSRKAGALRSALNIALNTDYAINLWQGRPPEEEGEKEGKKKSVVRVLFSVCQPSFKKQVVLMPIHLMTIRMLIRRCLSLRHFCSPLRSR